MTMRRPFLLSIHAVGVVVLLLVSACSRPVSDSDFPVLSGSYLGQTPPEGTPILFAPGIISTALYTRDVAMTPDGNEIYYGVMAGGFAVIMETKQVDGRWTKPRVAPFSGDPRFLDLEPHISPDGKHFYWLSTRPPDQGAPDPDEIGTWTNQDIWAMDRMGNVWGEPYNLGMPINTDAAEFFPSVTIDGTMYFTRNDEDPEGSYIYRSRLTEGRYAEPEKLPSQVNSTTQQYNAFIAPDESYLILGVAGRDDTYGGTDYYVVFRNSDDSWSEPINMGETVNQERGAEWSPYVSPDGKYFFFMSTRGQEREPPRRLTFDYLMELHNAPEGGNPGIYWVDAGFIEELRPH
jgi:hypothetical protein